EYWLPSLFGSGIGYCGSIYAVCKNNKKNVIIESFMRNKVSFLIIIAISGLMTMVASCTSVHDEVVPEEVSVVSDDSSLDSATRQDLSVLQGFYGFKRETIQITPSTYVVEGDMLFERDSFQTKYAPKTMANARHYRHWLLVAPQYRNIPVYFWGNVPDVWKNAIRTAISRWNAENRSIRFYETSSFHTNGIGIRFINFYQNTLPWYGNPSTSIAAARMPYSDGKPGGEVVINSAWPGMSFMTQNQRIFTSLHELGHTIGFTHSDSPSEGIQIWTSIWGCNEGVDNASVMRVGNHSNTVLSFCDKQAFSTLY
ncbi:MAG: M57 family metalloprotease, partial [Candidatus Absconditabacterales bacterium]|nr:M57 family metalloprotease [Candidatus Absconditabacterales bacterium]